MVEKTPMKIALVHNFYRHFGGEDAYVGDLDRLLSEHGQPVCCFFRNSRDLTGAGGRLKALLSGFGNPFAVRRFREFLERERPDVVHLHNLFPLISPAILPVCRKMRIPVVMTVHNYRLFCPSGLLYTHGEICEQCAAAGEWHCVARNCMGNHLQSLAYAGRNALARQLGWYRRNVTTFLALTEFQRRKLLANGFPEERVAVLPNMVPLPPDGPKYEGDYVAYAGRLSPEKGIELILAAAARLPEIPFKLAGGGEGAARYRQQSPPNVEWVGELTRVRVADFLRQSRLAVMASTWYEGMPLTVLESLSLGKPAVVPRLAGFPEIIADGETGWCFEPGNADDLATRIALLWSDPKVYKTCSVNAERAYFQRYAPECHYRQLLTVYRRAINEVNKASDEKL